MLPFLPPEDDDPGTMFVSRPKGILLTQDFETVNFHKIGYFDFEWGDGIYQERRDVDIKGFEERRDLFRK